LFSGRKVPELDGVVKAGGRKQLAVGAERHAVNQRGVALEFGRGLSPRQRIDHQKESYGQGELAEHVLSSALSLTGGGDAARELILCNSPRHDELQQVIWPARL